MRIKVTVRVMTRNPQLQSVTVHKVEGEYRVESINGVIRLPEPKMGEPLSQLNLAGGGTVDLYETYQEILERMDAAK